MIVQPAHINLLLRLLPGRAPIAVQTRLPQLTVEGLDRAAVRRLATTADVEAEGVGVRSRVHGNADEIGAVVAVDALREATLEPKPLQREIIRRTELKECQIGIRDSGLGDTGPREAGLAWSGG